MSIAVLDLSDTGLRAVVVAATPDGDLCVLDERSIVLDLGAAVRRAEPEAEGRIELVLETVRRLVAASRRAGASTVHVVVGDGLADPSAIDLRARIGEAAGVRVRCVGPAQHARLLLEAAGGRSASRAGLLGIDLADDTMHVVLGRGTEPVWFRRSRPGVRELEAAFAARGIVEVREDTIAATAAVAALVADAAPRHVAVAGAAALGATTLVGAHRPSPTRALSADEIIAALDRITHPAGAAGIRRASSTAMAGLLLLGALVAHLDIRSIAVVGAGRHEWLAREALGLPPFPAPAGPVPVAG